MPWILQSLGGQAGLEHWPALPRSTRFNSCKSAIATRFPTKQRALEVYADYRDCVANPWPHEPRRVLERFRVTYEIVTDESAESGDVLESGFIKAGGNRVAARIGQETPGVDMRLRQALREAGEGGPWQDNGRWLSQAEGNTDHKGDTETRAIHPPRNITPASYRRLCALLDAH